MKYKFQDLIDIDHFQKLQDSLAEIYTFPSAIIDNDGNVLTASSWQDICVKFHRKNKECEKDCIKSDQYILDHLHEANPAVSYQCPHGLVDNATPIIIDGVHYGNFFTGQFFLEKPDLDFFRAQAKKYGFDENAYLDAVRKVPIWTQEQLNSYLYFIKALIIIISESGLKNLREIEVRKQIEESEERSKSIIQTALDGFWLVDKEGRLLEVNETYCQMSGYTKEELLSMRIPDLESSEADTDTAAHIQKVIEHGEDRFESKHKRKDGSVFDVEVSTQYRASEGGQLVAFLRDITERKNSEKTLSENEEIFSSFMENSPFYIFFKDENMRSLRLSRNYETMLGKPLAELLGKSTYDLFPSALAKSIVEDDIRTLKEGKLIAVEEEFNDRVYSTIKFPIFIEGNPRYLAGYTMDITEKKLAEEKEASRKKQLTLITDSYPGPVSQVSRDLRYKFANRKYEEWFGLSTETIVGMEMRDVIGEKTYKVSEANIQKALAGEQVVYENNTVNNVGETFYGLVTYTPYYEKDNVPAGFYIFVTDITFQKLAEEKHRKLEAQLLQSQKMEAVGRLAGGVAHDFNNMLAVILGNTELAMDSIESDNPLHDFLTGIYTAAQRSANLTKQLLAYARKQTVSPKVLDLNESVESMLTMLTRLIGEDISLSWRPCDDLDRIKIDPSQVDQILANLCVNARDAIADVGRITIETDNLEFDEAYCADHLDFIPGKFVMLAVSDDGTGMDKQTQAQIFEPFFTSKKQGAGTGLGLATVYGIVKQNEGFISVYSELGEGTTFKIYFPRYGEKGDQTTKLVSPETTKRGSETILLVEDEPSILKLSKIMLERLGYNVLAAGAPGEAIRLADGHSGKIHLLITDVVMPEMNGRDLAKNLLTLYPTLKRLFMSGYTANVIAHHGVLDVGVNFIQKPFSMKDIGAKVRDVLDND